MPQDLEEIISMSFKITRTLHQKLNEKVIADGYGMRGKSKWIKEAIESLFAILNYPELVSLSAFSEKVGHTLTVRLPRSLVIRIEMGILEVRQHYPDLEGVKSKIARTAIFQRLIRN